jgi:site-specific DNA-methyltransferase (adenine-specific)
MHTTTLINGDCNDILKTFKDQSIDIVISDIPYGINFQDWDVKSNNKNSALLGNQEHSTFKTRGKPLNGWSKDDRSANKEYRDWCSGWAKHLYRITKPCSPILLFCGRRTMHSVAVAMEEEGFIIRDILMWIKDKSHAKAQRFSKVLEGRNLPTDEWENVRLGNLKPDYEPILYLMKPYKGTVTDCILKYGLGGFKDDKGDIPSNIFYYESVKKPIHPTEKPLDLMIHLVKTFSLKPGQVILDPFCGSGTLCEAAAICERNSIGIDISENYIELAKKRCVKNTSATPKRKNNTKTKSLKKQKHVPKS